MFLLVGPAAVRAHGLPPSALGIVAADDNGQPSMVLLNEGLAFEHDDRWSFLCPRLWGDPDTSAGKTPLAWSLDGVETWIIGADDLYSARDGVLTPQRRPDLSSASIVGLAADDGALFGLQQSSDGSAIVRIDDDVEAPLFTSPEFWSWLAIGEDRVHVARVTEAGEVARLALDRQGVPIEEFVHAIDGTRRLAQLRLRPTARGLFAVTYDGQQYTLVAIAQDSWQVVLQSPGPIQGPQASAGGGLWVAANGELMREADGGFEAVGETRVVTCLEQYGSFAYACVGSDLHRLDDDGLAARIFQLDHLNELDPALIPAPAARECNFQWLLFRNDLERTGLAPLDFIDPEADGGAEPATDAAAPVPAAPDAGRDRPSPTTGGSGCECSAVHPRARARADVRWFEPLSAVSFAGLLLRRLRKRGQRARRTAR